MNNPFLYGEEVSGKQFIDRETELGTLIKDIESNERVFIISPRRYGKTSLIGKLSASLQKKGWLAARIDLYKVSSLESFANFYTTSVINAIEPKYEKWLRIFKDVIPQIRPTIAFQENGQPEFLLDIKQRSANEILIDTLLNLPDKIASKYRKKVVIAFDEFQELRLFGGVAFEKSLRSNIQKHHHVSYLFAGSKKNMMNDIVTNPSSAFYKMGKILYLDKIPRDYFEKYLIEQYRCAKMALTAEAIDKIFSVTENIPYNIQYLSHQLWDYCYGKKVINADDILYAVNKIVMEQSPLYITLWDNLTLIQRKLLIALAAGNGKNIFSNDFLMKYGLGSAATVQTSVKLLIDRELLDKEGNKYIFQDIFFKEWIKRQVR